MEANLLPKEIKAYLDDYIIGQDKAKKTIAIALRNRYRRMQLPKDIQDEITPKNILMIGSTGVGKTEVARRLAKMMNLPFIKVEASKFTEVGYVGRDVDSMVRDLVYNAYDLVKKDYEKKLEKEIEDEVNRQIIERLIPPLPKGATEKAKESFVKAYNKMEEKLLSGKLDDQRIKLAIPKKPRVEVTDTNIPIDVSSLQDSLTDMMKPFIKDDEKEIRIKDARRILRNQVSETLLDIEAIKTEAIEKVENGGIIFIDEIDKIALSNTKNSDPSKEGVQRDLLPIVEGSIVHTKYGNVDTKHILFIAAGAFHVSKPSDLLPELQGRFPLRVELDMLDEEALYKILSSTKNSLLKQYEALFSVEDVKLIFSEEAIRAFAKLSYEANLKTEDIGARRLHTVIEKVLEDISYEIDKYIGKEIVIDKELVYEKLKDIVENEDTTRYIL